MNERVVYKIYEKGFCKSYKHIATIKHCEPNAIYELVNYHRPEYKIAGFSYDSNYNIVAAKLFHPEKHYYITWKVIPIYLKEKPSSDKQKLAIRLCVKAFNVPFLKDINSFKDCSEFLDVYFPRYKAVAGKPKYQYKVRAIVYGKSILLGTVPFCSTYYIDKIRKLVKEKYNINMKDFYERDGRVLAETDNFGITIEIGIIPII